MKSIDLIMQLKIVQRWLFHAVEIIMIRGQETALFSCVHKSHIYLGKGIVLCRG